MRIGIYPGSFDPFTYGHLDIVERARKICDKLIIATAINISKKPLFTVEERVDMIRQCCEKCDNVEIVSFDGLLADYCKENKIGFIARGIRSTGDFEKEYAVAIVNNKLAPDTETVFFVSGSEFSFISSSMVKEVAAFGGDVTALVPQFVNIKLMEKFTPR